MWRKRNRELEREGELLKRRVIRLGSMQGDRWRQIAVLYRLADGYGRRVFRQTYCHEMADGSTGCITGACCACQPDVFTFEQELLDRLPKRLASVGECCPFFNRTRKNCGIYGVRPFACRIYYNMALSRHSCRNPAEETLQLFDNLKRHLAEILGPYAGGYLPENYRQMSEGRDRCSEKTVTLL
jgi:uncharacterized protein